MENQLSRPTSLETVPLEILNHIFLLTCSDNLDLNLLLVSRAMTWKLLGHPVVQTVRAFWPVERHTRSLGWWLQSPVPVPVPPGPAPSWGVGCESDERKRMQEDVLASAWCTQTFLRRMQIAFIRRMVEEHWDPFLERDGLKKCTESQPAFWALLDRVASGRLPTEEMNMEICLTDNETRYSWTRIRIWPWQGRIVIRDQLLNKSFEKTLQFLQSMIVAKERCEHERSDGIDG